VAINHDTKLLKIFLQHYFGFNNFRPGQLGIVLSILKKQNTLAILPTGGGKSICFQVPALIFPGISIIISPLISLMKDQVDHLLAKNISATFINSQLDKKTFEKRKPELIRPIIFFVTSSQELSNDIFSWSWV
jgi:ATP-dependent DNA helicase RecQ